MSLYMKIHRSASIMWLKDAPNLRNPEVVKYRLDCLAFWNKHGLAAALDYAGVSRSTLYKWKKDLSSSRGLDYHHTQFNIRALDPKSKRPHHCRKRTWQPSTVKTITQLVSTHPELGKNKVYHILRRQLIHSNQPNKMVSESTVGRILGDLRSNGKLPSKDRVRINATSGKLHIVRYRRRITKLRRKMLPKVTSPGDLVQIDGVEGFFNGQHYYITNAIDYISGKVVSKAYRSKGSGNMAKFLADLPKRIGFKIKAIQTDNGSEYAALFHAKAEAMGIAHCFNYVKKPIYNGKVERFNRTLQEALCNDLWFMENLAYDLPAAQRRIDAYTAFYNNERPHSSINYATPSEYVLQYLQRNPKILNVLN